MFVLAYAAHIPPGDLMYMPVEERKWLVKRLLKQLDKETKALTKGT